MLQLARARHVSLQFATPNVLVLLEKRVWEENPALEDPALPAACCSAVALLPFRRRLYGVLLHEGDDAEAAAGRATVREFFPPNSVPEGGRLHPVDVVPAALGEHSSSCGNTFTTNLCALCDLTAI